MYHSYYSDKKLYTQTYVPIDKHTELRIMLLFIKTICIENHMYILKIILKEVICKEDLKSIMELLIVIWNPELSLDFKDTLTLGLPSIP